MRIYFVHKKKATHPLDFAAHHRKLGGGACEYRQRHQGAGFRHRQRLLHGGSCHRPRVSDDPERRRWMWRPLARLGGLPHLRRHARLAGHARASPTACAPSPSAQRHGMAKAQACWCSKSWSTRGRAAPGRSPSCAGFGMTPMRRHGEPRRRGRQRRHAMALRMLASEADIDYMNAHGTATAVND